MLQYSACKNIRRTSLKPAQQVHRPERYNWNKQEIKNYRRNKNYTQLRALILCTWHTPTRRDVSERHVKKMWSDANSGQYAMLWKLIQISREFEKKSTVNESMKKCDEQRKSIRCSKWIPTFCSERVIKN